ncbi:MAG: cobyrinate a,c-diamide synthase [Selenomonadaceae bacterium]|nr:cobyrinate a,c-diamide synthase [Selenomonadaceae bacterium]
MVSIVIAATHSGAGKTTITCGIIAALKKRGLKVQPYKIGPDYIDTGFHELAAGRPAENLDSRLMGKEKILEIFQSADADVAIIEGVMGLYDGGRGGISSTAEIAKLLDLPVILIVDAKSVGTSAAAMALGFREYDKELNFAGVILNRIGSAGHEKMIVDALNDIDIKSFGAVRRDDEMFLPSRHLGLVQAEEIDFSPRVDYISEKISAQINLDELLAAAKKIPTTSYKLPATSYQLQAKIGVARDEAFSFYYAESLRELERMGAEIIFFSPLHDFALPKVDGIIFGGGYPENFAAQLEGNKKIRTEINRAANAGLPIFAECGGYMYLMRSLMDCHGKIFEMCDVIPSQALMTRKLQMVGYVDATLTRDCIIGKRGEKIHAHEFHFSKEVGDTEKIFECEKLRTGEKYFAGYANENIVASYLHVHFSGCPRVAENFLRALR